jgi:hypothetical protein
VVENIKEEGMKRIYVKPEQEIVELQYCETLLAGSVTSIDSSLSAEDDLLIDDTLPTDNSFWGR